MGKVIQQKIKGMNIWAKVGLVTTITLLVSVFMYQGWYKPRQASAAVTVSDAWVNLLTGASSGNATYTTAVTGTTNTFAVSNNADRVTLVGVCLETAANATISSIDVRLDTNTGTQFNLVDQSTGSQREQCYMGWLPNVAAGTHDIYLNVTMSGSTISGLHIDAGTFQGVDTTTPIASSAVNNNSTSATITFGTAVTYPANSMITYIAAAGNTATAANPPATFTNILTNFAADQSTAVANATTPSGTYPGTTAITFTGASTRSAIVVASLSPSLSPTISSLSPNNLGQGATSQTVTINGANFVSGATVGVSGSGVTLGAVTFVNATQLTVPITVNPAATTGARTLTVTNPDSKTGTSTFTVNAAPTVTSATPNNQDQGSGPTTVTITGTGFQTGAVVTFSNPGVTAGVSTFVSATSITVPVTVTAGAATGAGTITVTNSDVGAGTGGTFTVNFSTSATYNTAGTFSWTAPPGVTSVTVKCWGGGGKGGTRTTTGAGGGAGGGAYSLQDVTVIPGNSYNVYVGAGSTTTAAGGDSYFINTSTVLAKGGASVANDTATGATGGAAASGVGSTKYSGGNGVNGSSGNYGGGAGSSAGTAAIGANGTTSNGGTAPAGGGDGGNGTTTNNTVGFAGTAPGGGGGGAMRATGGGGPWAGGNGADGQVVLSFIAVVNPTVTSTSPNTLQIGDTADVTITGTGFQSGATASFGAGITVNSVTFNSATSLTANITVTATTGARNVTVTNADSSTGTGTGVFTVTAAPAVASTSPNSRTQGQTNQNITITGTGFSNTPTAPTVLFSGTGITVNSVIYTNATTLTANIDVAPSAAIGARNVTVTNARGSAGTGSSVFTVNAAPAPTVTSTSPNSAGQGANNINVTINGTNFVSGATVAFSGTGITVNSTTFNSAISLTANISISSGAAVGARNVTVTNPNTLNGTLTGGFTVNAGVCVRSAPTVSLGSAGSVVPGSSLAYVVSLTNNDAAFGGCLPTSTFALTLSDTNGTDFTIPSTLSPTSIAVAPGATGTVTLTVTSKAAAAVGNTNTTTVTATDGTNHAGQPGSGNVITTAVSSWINNNLLHNSDNLQSLKHGGAWGKPGTFLGAIICSTCHSPAKSGNIGRIRTSLSAPDGSFTNRTVTFTTHSGVSTSFGDDTASHATSFKICEVCHTSDGNSSYVQNSNGTYVHAYNQGAARQHYNNNDCTRCHGHEWSFEGESRGGRTCGPCHRTAYLSMQSKSGYHHYMFDSYTGYPHAAPTSDSQKSCLQCHVDHNIFRPEVNPANTGALGGRAANLRVDIVGTDPVKGTTTPGTGTNQYVRSDFVSTATNYGICVSCHDAAMTKSTNQQDSRNTQTPVIAGAAYSASMHDYSASGQGSKPVKAFKDGSRFKANCSKCHDAQNNEPSPNFTDVATHDSKQRRLISTFGGSVSDPLLPSNPCFRCHHKTTDTGTPGGGPLKTVANRDYMDATAMTAASQDTWATFNGETYGHHVDLANYTSHSPTETGSDISSHKHITCADCHNVHAAQVGNHTAASATLAPVLTGTAGVTPTFSATNWGGVTSYAQTSSSTSEYQICFKCHSGANTNVATWGGTGATAWTDLGLEFNPNNGSYHPVIQPLPAAYTDGVHSKRLAAGALTGGWVPGGVMTCSDCHATDSSASKGPHGSAVKWMLNPNTTGTKYYNWPYTLAANNGLSTGTLVLGTGRSTLPGNNFCFSCHVWSGGGGAHTGCDSHDISCVGCHIRVPHGGKMVRLLTSPNAPGRYKPDGNGGGTTYLGSVTQASGTGTIGMGACGVTGGCNASEHPNDNTSLW